MQIKNYRDLIFWQKSMSVVKQVYDLTSVFPQKEVYGLTAQIRRSAISIPSNIAEGRHRGSRKDFRQFLIIARGSIAELETQLTLSLMLNYCSDSFVKPIMNELNETSRMLAVIVRKLDIEARS